MAITIEKLIDLLNMDLELEYSAAIQYINHAAVMTGAAYGDIIKELNTHATEEIQHAMTLAQQLRNILATEQEHAMDLKQALGK